VFHDGRSLLGVQFRTSTRFPPRAADMRAFFRAPANESAKRFAGDIEAGVGEPLPDLFVRLSGAQRDFDFKQERTEEGGLRPGLSPSNEGRSPSAGLRSCGGESPQRRDRSSPKRRRRHDPTLLDSIDKNLSL